jgi:hypothetical protein
MARGLRSVAVLLGSLGLAGCSGTPFGDQLSRSFSSPTTVPAPAPAARPAPAAAPTASRPAPAAKAPAAARPAEPAARLPVKPRPPAQPSAPSPYRVTIKLPAADPSAPAEVVTQALRAAGVAFEVETIERIPAAAEAPVTPLRTPAPPAR